MGLIKQNVTREDMSLSLPIPWHLKLFKVLHQLPTFIFTLILRGRESICYYLCQFRKQRVRRPRRN